MRKELYKALCEKLKSIGDGEIKHIDLWNRNVEFIEQEEAWERPAVFIEICPITWEQTTGGRLQRGTGLVKLHIITDWSGSAADGSSDQDTLLEMFDWSEKIQKAIDGLTGEMFHSLHLVETYTNHDHEEIVESIEVYKLRGVRQI